MKFCFQFYPFLTERTMEVFDTQRLLVRQFTSDDIGAFHAIISDYEAISLEQAQLLLKHTIDTYFGSGWGRWAIVLKETGEVIGLGGPYVSNALQIDGYKGSFIVSLSVAFRKEHRRKGYLTELTPTALEVLKDDFWIKKVVAAVEPWNFASKMAIQKLLGVSSWVKGTSRGRPVEVYTVRLQEKSDEPVAILDWLYVGSVDAAQNRDGLNTEGITHVFSAIGPTPLQHENITYESVHLQDSMSQEIDDAIEKCNSFLRSCKEKNGKALVHCYAGVSRSVSLIIGYLLTEDSKDYDTIFSFVRSRHKWAEPNSGFEAKLRSRVQKQ